MRARLYIIGGLLMCTGTASASDSTITITGNVADNACEVDAGSQNFTVDLLSSASKQFSSVGAVTPPVPFSVKFSRCGSTARAVRIGFTGTADSNNPALLQLVGGAGVATGMGVQLLDSRQNSIAVNAAQTALNWVTLASGQPNTVAFYAQLKASRMPVTAGTVKADATFTLEYQ